MRRSTAVLGLGAVALLGSWLFGSLALAPAGIGLVAAGVGARVWRLLVEGSLTLERSVADVRLVEGEELVIELRLRGGAGLFGRAVAHETLSGPGGVPVLLRRGRGVLRVPHAPRGCHRLGPVRVTLEGPLGLEHADAAPPAPGTVVVRPRFVVLGTLFSDGSGVGLGGRRPRIRRPAGTDLHSVRDYREGEPLRLVHWPTTARRGQLTVLDMQDAPRDEIVVVLDGDPRGVAGPTGRSSFDEATRVAASLVRSLAGRRRRVALAGASAGGGLVRVTGVDSSFTAALDALAAAEPDEQRTLTTLLSDPRLAGRSAVVVIVTCRPEVLDTPPVRARVLAGLVVVDAPTYAGAPPSTASPAVLRVSGEGTPVAVVRAGDDLASALGGIAGAARSA